MKMNVYDCRTDDNCQAGCPKTPCCPQPCCTPCCPPICIPCQEYAMFHILDNAAASNTDLTLLPILISSGQVIAPVSGTEISLAQGHIFEISYQVTATGSTAGSFQVEPLINLVPEASHSTTAQLSEAGMSASVSAAFLVSTLTAPGTFSLQYTGPNASSVTGAVVIRELA
ncbi:Uncharacterised protein [uncultured Ruminococcus sp.]|nr:Uncharacterised protein [uncultured Clostridium sp.]SCH70639.1 Uncharacterised protein [uncultured Ruminococcus sp.]